MPKVAAIIPVKRLEDTASPQQYGKIIAETLISVHRATAVDPFLVVSQRDSAQLRDHIRCALECKLDRNTYSNFSYVQVGCPHDGRFGDADKVLKLHWGMSKLLEDIGDYTHFYPLDCDDLIRQDFARRLISHYNTVLCKGYEVVGDRAWAVNKLYERNGSSHVYCKDFIAEAVDRIEVPSTGWLFHRREPAHRVMSGDKYEWSVIRDHRPVVAFRTYHGENTWFTEPKHPMWQNFKRLVSPPLPTEFNYWQT